MPDPSDLSDAAEVLARCPLFRGLDARSFALLAGLARLESRAKGYRFFNAGDPAPGLYLVRSGLCRVYQLNAQGREHVLHLPGPGATFAEVAVFGGFPAPATVEALEDCEVVVLPARELRDLLDRDHALCRQLLIGLSGWVRHLVGLLEDIALRDAVGRLARHLLERADAAGLVELPMAKRHLANHLALTPETFSRCLRRLEDSGLISNIDGHLRVCDRAGLANLAEGLGPLV